MIGDHTFTEAELNALFDEMDADGDQFVTTTELTEFALRKGLAETNAEKFDSAIQAKQQEAGTFDNEGVSSAGVNDGAWYIGDRKKFKFMVRPYDPAFFWFGIIDYARKFVLSGVLVFCAPGSNTQTFCAIVVSFVFLLVATRTLLGC